MNKLFRTIKFIEENCRGCTKCMNKCPMEAIRLKNSKAVIYEDKCIDCGVCVRECPYKAYVATKNNLEEIEGYKVKVAIASVTLYSQFGDYVHPSIIEEGIKKLGFDEVFDSTYACDIASEIMKKEVRKIEKPAISIFCPSIASLIHTSYPSLLDRVVKVMAPIEIAANLIRERYSKEGYKYEDVGIFYLSPCASWMNIVGNQSENAKEEINGIISISDIYRKLLKEIKSIPSANETSSQISYSGLAWAYPGGISKSLNSKESIVVDGVQNAKKVFNDVENGKLNDVEFIEAYACHGGCLGGVFLVENPYNAKRICTKYQNRIKHTHGVEAVSDDYREQFVENNRNIKVSNAQLADDFASAVKKMKYMNKLMNILPATDCGQCGSPSCKAFAEDVVRGRAILEECIPLQKEKEKEKEQENGGGENEG